MVEKRLMMRAALVVVLVMVELTAGVEYITLRGTEKSHPKML